MNIEEIDKRKTPSVIMRRKLKRISSEMNPSKITKLLNDRGLKISVNTIKSQLQVNEIISKKYLSTMGPYLDKIISELDEKKDLGVKVKDIKVNDIEIKNDQ